MSIEIYHTSTCTKHLKTPQDGKKQFVGGHFYVKDRSSTFQTCPQNISSQNLLFNVGSSINNNIFRFSKSVFLFFDFLFCCGQDSLSLQYEFVTSYQCFYEIPLEWRLVQNGKMMIHTKLRRICPGCLFSPQGVF